MPTYEYKCHDCQCVFEVRQPISAEPLTACEQCGGSVRRLLRATPFILKGGGWYVTDYPSAGRKKGLEAEKKSTGDAAPSAAPTTTGTDGGSTIGAASKSGATSSEASSAAAPTAKPTPTPTPSS